MVSEDEEQRVVPSRGTKEQAGSFEAVAEAVAQMVRRS